MLVIIIFVNSEVPSFAASCSTNLLLERLLLVNMAGLKVDDVPFGKKGGVLFILKPGRHPRRIVSSADSH